VVAFATMEFLAEASKGHRRDGAPNDYVYIPPHFSTEFVPENFGQFRMGMDREEDAGAVPPKNSKTSQMRDPGPPKDMRVKSGYTGHVPMGRDFIGGSYKHHDNRGTAGKSSVPVIHKDAAGNYPIKMKPAQSEIQKLISHDPFSQKPGDMQHDYGVKTTAPVPVRIEKVLSADYSDLDDAANAALMADDSDSKMLHGGQRDMGGLGTWVMAGYTGHVPKAREMYGTSYYGPPEGPSYHGPFYTSDKYAQPGSPNKESICP